MTGRTAVTLLVALVLLAGACTSGRGEPGRDDPSTIPPVVSPTAAVPDSPEVVPEPEAGPGSALAAYEELCTIPKPTVGDGADVPAEGPTHPTIAGVMDELEQIRGFGFARTVVAEPVSQQEIAEGYSEYLETAFPDEFYERRSRAWETIGVVPPGTSIRDELLEYGNTQVIGYYDTLTGELKFIGAEDPSPLERVTLAHELTHAIDDQRFGLETIDLLGASCRDEELQAALAVVEGNATYFMLRWAQTFLSAEEQLQMAAEAARQSPPPSDIAPFITAVQGWPYIEGMRFITRLERDGGLEAVDAAFRDLPVSTEQIMHPERYPNDLPVPVDVPDLAPALGRGWTDLDVQFVGEMWLRLALALRLEDEAAAGGAAGWDGGLYRAWARDGRVALVLGTVWDTDQDALEFAEAMNEWVGEGSESATVLPADGNAVRVLFASDDATLALLRAAA
jgi:hypothetical protein